MVDRVPSDHPSITTVRATLSKSGATSRPVLELPTDGDVAFPRGDVVRIVVDGTVRHAEPRRPLTGDGLVISGIYDTPDAAREKDGPDRLGEWVEDAAVSFGGSVLIDEVEPGFEYGLRAPGERVVYDATESPDDSLADIAEDLADRD